jgi:APA family basic amino acid/polyamine antiporter
MKKPDLSRLMRKRSFFHEATGNSGHQMKRVLGPFDLILLGLGATIGFGIFVVSGRASSMAGPGVIFLFIIASVCCLAVAFCYAELAAMIPVAGSAYTYTYTIIGELGAWIVGWSVLTELTVAVSVIASGWSRYFSGMASAAGILLPQDLIAEPQAGGLIDLPAVIIICVMALFLIQGLKESARLNTVLVAIKVGVLGLFFVFGFQAIQAGNYFPVFPEGLQGVLSGAGLIIVSYLGFETIASSAEEVKDPQKTLPRGLIGTLVILTILYILTGLVLTGIAPYTSYAHIAAPIFYALNLCGMPLAGGIVAAGALIGLTSGSLVVLYAASRLVYAISRDGLLPVAFSSISGKGIPLKATIVVTVIGAILAGFTTIEFLTDLVIAGALVAFIAVAAEVLIMRQQQPVLHRPFRCPFVPLVPCLAIVTGLIMMSTLKAETLIVFCALMGIGLATYVVYGMRR